MSLGLLDLILDSIKPWHHKDLVLILAQLHELYIFLLLFKLQGLICKYQGTNPQLALT